MALNIVFDDFEYVESDSEGSLNLSPIQKQTLISPVESESSSGISSLDSVDIKKQLIFLPQTITNLRDQDDEEEHSNESSIFNENFNSEENNKKKEFETDEKNFPPVKIIYQNRNILNLADNILNTKSFVQHTVLPDYNLNYFFQNRAQYWRLKSSTSSDINDTLEKCSCCDFCYPEIYQQQLHQTENSKHNNITDSLLKFLKTCNVDLNAIPNSNDNNTQSKNHNNYVNNSNTIGNNKQRMYSNIAQFTSYKVVQHQQQQYQNNVYKNNMSGFNQFSSFHNNNNEYNINRTSGTSLVNMMNQPRNVTSAFQQNMSSDSRFHNININGNNINSGLYKQF